MNLTPEEIVSTWKKLDPFQKYNLAEGIRELIDPEYNFKQDREVIKKACWLAFYLMLAGYVKCDKNIQTELENLKGNK
jgi:hypothetical protein